jgi:hypothetical protein
LITAEAGFAIQSAGDPPLATGDIEDAHPGPECKQMRHCLGAALLAEKIGAERRRRLRTERLWRIEPEDAAYLRASASGAALASFRPRCSAAQTV